MIKRFFKTRWLAIKQGLKLRGSTRWMFRNGKPYRAKKLGFWDAYKETLWLENGRYLAARRITREIEFEKKNFFTKNKSPREEFIESIQRKHL